MDVTFCPPAKANQKKYLVSSIPTDPLFFQKRQKEKEKRGVVFRWLVAATPLPVSSKERWAWPRHSTPTDRPAVERDSRDTGNKVFLLVGLSAKWVLKTAKPLELQPWPCIVITVSNCFN